MKEPDVDLRQLRYFVAIADAGSFTGAALTLHIAQSALSRHMKMLEEALGGELFERGARGVVLTDSGMALLRNARFVLARIEDTRTEVLALNGEVRGTVNLAMPSSLSSLICVPMVSHFLDHLPGVALHLSEGTSQNVLGRIRDATLDVGVVTQPQPERHLDLEELGQEKLMLMGPAGDPLLRKRGVAPEILPTIPVMMAGGLVPILGKWARDVRPVVLVDSTAPIKGLILAGRGYAVVPLSSAWGDLAREGLAAVPLKGLHLTRFIATHRGRPVSQATRAVIRYLQEAVEPYLKDPRPA